MLGKSAGFEDVAQLLFAPATAGLGRVAERVNKLGGLARDAFLAEAHLFDLPLEVAEGVAALGLDLGDALFVTRQAIVDWLEQ